MVTYTVCCPRIDFSLNHGIEIDDIIPVITAHIDTAVSTLQLIQVNRPKRVVALRPDKIVVVVKVKTGGLNHLVIVIIGHNDRSTSGQSKAQKQ